MGFSRQEYWSRFPCPPPRDLPHPGKTWTQVSCVFWIAGRFFTAEPLEKPACIQVAKVRIPRSRAWDDPGRNELLEECFLERGCEGSRTKLEKKTNQSWGLSWRPTLAQYPGKVGPLWGQAASLWYSLWPLTVAWSGVTSQARQLHFSNEYAQQLRGVHPTSEGELGRAAAASSVLSGVGR